MPFPTPPADNSGGFLLLTYTNGTDAHKQRVHVLPFSSTPSGSSNDRLYTTPPSGGESGVLATFTAWANQWKTVYGSGWTIGISALYQNSGGNLVEQFPPPVAAPVAGTAAGTDVATGRALEIIINAKTKGGKAIRFIFIAGTATVYSVPVVLVAGTGTLGLILQYLQGSTTAIVGHDGQQTAAGNAKATYAINRRLRRRYGQA